MGKQELDNLVQIGKLKAEAASRKEFDGMLASARRGLVDAQNESIETDSRINRPRPERLTLKSKKPETLEKAGDFGPVA
jgi:hypothetical protein